MTLGWELKNVNCEQPKAILSFYSPSDFESGGKLTQQAR